MKEQIASMAIGALLELVKFGIDELKKRGAVDLGPIGYSASDFRKVDKEVDKLIDAFYEAQSAATLMGAVISSNATFDHVVHCDVCRDRFLLARQTGSFSPPPACLRRVADESARAARQQLATLVADSKVAT